RLGAKGQRIVPACHCTRDRELRPVRTIAAWVEHRKPAMRGKLTSTIPVTLTAAPARQFAGVCADPLSRRFNVQAHSIDASSDDERTLMCKSCHPGPRVRAVRGPRINSGRAHGGHGSRPLRLSGNWLHVAVRASRRARGALLSMRKVPDRIKKTPHPE